MRDQIERMEAQIAELRASANSVARSAGLPLPYPDKRTPTPSIGELAVARVPMPGQFGACGSLEDALLAYFEWRGRALGAVSIDDLLMGLVIGGVPALSRDDASKERLRELLGRDTRFGRLRNGYYALAGWLTKTKPPNE
jgi:hypothetical protein